MDSLKNIKCSSDAVSGKSSNQRCAILNKNKVDFGCTPDEDNFVVGLIFME